MKLSTTVSHFKREPTRASVVALPVRMLVRLRETTGAGASCLFVGKPHCLPTLGCRDTTLSFAEEKWINTSRIIMSRVRYVGKGCGAPIQLERIHGGAVVHAEKASRTLSISKRYLTNGKLSLAPKLICSVQSVC